MWAPLRLVKKRIFFLIVLIFLLSYCIFLIFDPAQSKYDKRSSDWVSVRLGKGQHEYVDKRGIRVVVGHYMGPDVKNVNLSKDILNQNEFSPELNAGKDGQPVMIAPKNLLKMQQLFQINAFNLLASDSIPLNRSLKDARNQRCKMNAKIDISNLPTASVIIVFHNEAWSTLLRTVWSVINRSPPEILKEIILVDDASKRDFLKEPLKKYVASLPVMTTIIRMPTRSGLIRARISGAKRAQGKVLVFLDAHCECTTGWLEGLLERISDDPTRVVCPVIDIINKDTFAYTKIIESSMGAFNWHLTFRWFYLTGDRLTRRGSDMSAPILTPAMAGGLFAMDREYFFALGAYDEEMFVWGGENVELSLRVWQCGGSVEIAPCSHVGHVFRLGSPYEWPGGSRKIIARNVARTALVWLDEYADFYFKFVKKESYDPEAIRNIDVSNRLALRKRLGCKSFKWYLDNVWPEHCLPVKGEFFGKIMNSPNNKCLYTPQGHPQDVRTGSAIIRNCSKEEATVEEMFIFKDDVIMTNECVCLEIINDIYSKQKQTEEDNVRLYSCVRSKKQKWEYDNNTHQIIHVETKKCLATPRSDEKDSGLKVKLCDKEEPSQLWTLQFVQWNTEKQNNASYAIDIK